MLDIQFIRDNQKLVEEAAKNKNVKVDVVKLIKLDDERRQLQGEVDELRSKRNELSRNQKGKPSQSQLAKAKKLKEQISKIEDKLTKVAGVHKELLLQVPNVPTEDTPIGKSEEDNVVSRQWGKKRKFSFTPKNHWEIAEPLGLIDKERAAKVAGSRFAYIKGDLVLLEFALWQFALSKLTDEKTLKKIIKENSLQVSSKPFIPVLPPAVANTVAYESTGRLNKEEQTYKLADDDLWLNASAEHTMAPMYLNEILDEVDFPIRYAGYTTAFRREAGTYGKDMEGILRLHQFNKLEAESFNLPEDSMEEHLFMIAIQEYLMQQLELPYQVVTKCTADIGFPNARGVDIEVWLPGQNQYRETHTADYIADYQARRMQTRLRRADDSLDIAHTNDATILSERPLIAILENYQRKDGRVDVPKVLQGYMGKKVIS